MSADTSFNFTSNDYHADSPPPPFAAETEAIANALAARRDAACDDYYQFCDGGGGYGYVDDCSGDGDLCSESWLGDGSCDGTVQESGCDLTCYGNDYGDCDDFGGGGDCDDTCYDYSCDYWVEDGYTCDELENDYGCDCSGCDECDDSGGDDSTGSCSGYIYYYDYYYSFDDGAYDCYGNCFPE